MGNKLRTALTLMIIIFGIMALIGILTATQGINQSVMSFSSEMGSNTFSIKNEGQTRHRRRRKAMVANPPITLLQSQEFKKNYKYPATVSTATDADGAAVVKYESRKTNPNVRIIGVDEDYLKVAGWAIQSGRNMSKSETDNGQNVILLGKDVVAKIFPPREEPLFADLTRLARAAWDLFDLSGYARVDFRVDGAGLPVILEVNANPCLSADAGFCAAAAQIGLTQSDIVARLVEAARQQAAAC